MRSRFTKHKFIKRIGAWITVLALVVGLMPGTVFAEGNANPFKIVSGAGSPAVEGSDYTWEGGILTLNVDDLVLSTPDNSASNQANAQIIIKDTVRYVTFDGIHISCSESWAKAIEIKNGSSSPTGVMPEITLKGENSIYSSYLAFYSPTGLTFKGSSYKTDCLDIHWGGIWSSGNLTVESVKLNVRSGGDSLCSAGGDIIIKDSTIRAESNQFAIKTDNLQYNGNITINDSVVTALKSNTNSFYGIKATGSIDFDNSFICSENIREKGGYEPSGTNSVLVALPGAGSAYTMIYNGSEQDGVGATFTLTKDAEIPEGFNLVLENGETLNIAKGVTLSGAGTLDYSRAGTTVNNYGECTVLTQIGPDSALYGVIYNANGGSGEMISTWGIPSGEEFSLPLCTFTAPENKFFMGWALSSDGEAIDTTKITIDKTVTLYALWGGVSVTPADSTSVEKGTSKQFSAAVDGVNNPAITWSVEGNSSADTTIDQNGVLTVALDETATSLIVKATYNGVYGTVDVTLAEHTHDIEHIEKVEPTCTTDGKEEYYACKTCGRYFENEAGTIEISDIDAYGVITAAGHDWDDNWTSNGGGTHSVRCLVCDAIGETEDCTAYSAATCSHGNLCRRCGEYFGDINPNLHGRMNYYFAQDANHYFEGNIEYWYCQDCGKYYKAADNDSTKPEDEITLEETIIPTVPHVHNGEYEILPQNLNVHQYMCDCGEMFNAEPHTLTWVVDTPATATTEGLQHEECTVCGYKFDPVAIPATGTADDGTSEDGTTDNETTDDGTTDNGTSHDGTTNDGTTDDGTTDNGTSNDGTTNDGASDNGTTNNGANDEKPADDNTSNDEQKPADEQKPNDKAPATGGDVSVLFFITLIMACACVGVNVIRIKKHTTK